MRVCTTFAGGICPAGASPDDIRNAISSWGVYGQLSETQQSETNGSRVLNITGDVMINLLHSAPFMVDPPGINLQAYNLGSVAINTKFSQASFQFAHLQSCAIFERLFPAVLLEAQIFVIPSASL